VDGVVARRGNQFVTGTSTKASCTTRCSVARTTVRASFARSLNDRVVVVDADPRWPQQFERSPRTSRVYRVGGRTDRARGIDPVPGLAAKPIIDIDVVVADEAQVPVVLRLIESAHYRWVGDLDVEGREAFEAPVTPRCRTITWTSWRNNRAHADHWLFRDSLIDDPA